MRTATSKSRVSGCASYSTMSTSSEKMITLRSSDGDTFEVEESVAVESQTIKHLIEDDCANSVIPLLNVSSKILSKVIEYCRKHVESAASAAAAPDNDKSGEEALKTWDTEFIRVDQSTLFDIILVRAEPLCRFYVYSLSFSRNVKFGCSIIPENFRM